MSSFIVAGLVASLAKTAAAHGYVQNILVGGTTYLGYNPAFQYQNPAPKVAGWSDPEDLGNGFIDPNNYTTPEIICHLGATPGQASIPVAAGKQVTFEWTPWPSTHKGPVINYLANCNGPCTSVDKTKLEWVKVDQQGLLTPGTASTWATDALIANNNSWTFTVPPTLAAGNYVARHEIIALHSAGNADGAQNYPQCVNLQVTGGGTAQPSGTLGTALYHSTDPGVNFNIYTNVQSYPIPGPTLWSGAVLQDTGSGTKASAEQPAVTEAPAAPATAKKACKNKRKAEEFQA